MPARNCRATARPSATCWCAVPGSPRATSRAKAAKCCVTDGWFATGDVATIDPDGYMHITDRSKDVIKSGGEWISSIDLENAAMAHPAVAEAAVIGIAHPKWDERPLLIVHRKTGADVDQGGADRLPRRQGRQMVAARRRAVRRRHPAHRDRQDPEDQAARGLQGLQAADGLDGRHRAQRKSPVAMKPSIVRRACRLPQRTMSARLSGPARSGSMAFSWWLTGMMISSV